MNGDVTSSQVFAWQRREIKLRIIICIDGIVYSSAYQVDFRPSLFGGTPASPTRAQLPPWMPVRT